MTAKAKTPAAPSKAAPKAKKSAPKATPPIRFTGTAPAPTQGSTPSYADPGMETSSGMLAIYAPPSDFIPSRFNVPHRHPDAEMVESIRAHGNFQPVLARPIGISAMIEHGLANRIPPEEAGAKRFELVLGERRWRACDIVGRPVLVIVRSLSDEEAMTLQFEENLHRQDLTPMQEATAFAHFLAQLGGDLDAAARKVHKSPAYLAKRLKLLELPKAGQDALQSGAILLGTAVEIACLSEADRLAAIALVMPHAGEDALPVREGRDRITARFHLRIAGARFPVDDAALVPTAGPCTTCPKRTSNQLALFTEGVKDDRCPDRTCWEAKTEAAWQRREIDAHVQQLTILDMRAEGKAGDKAKAALYHPSSAGLLDLDSECEPVLKEQITAAEERLALAVEEKDEAAITAAKAKLEQLEESDAPTWRDVLGPAVKLAAIGRSVRGGDRTEVHELMNERDAFEALRAKGHELAPWMERRLEAKPERKPEPQRPQETDTAKIERRAGELRRAALTTAILTAGENSSPRPEPPFWRAVILATVQAYDALGASTPGEMGDFEPMIRRRGWHVEDEQTLADVIGREIARLSQQKLRGVLLEVLCTALRNEDMAGLGRCLGLDVGAIFGAADEKAREELTTTPKKKRGAAPASGAEDDTSDATATT